MRLNKNKLIDSSKRFTKCYFKKTKPNENKNQITVLYPLLDENALQSLQN